MLLLDVLFVTAIIGELFSDKEAAFSHYHGWRGLGFCVTFSYGSFLCFQQKALIVLAMAGLALVTYVTLEALLRWGKKTNMHTEVHVIGNIHTEAHMMGNMDTEVHVIGNKANHISDELKTNGGSMCHI